MIPLFINFLFDKFTDNKMSEYGLRWLRLLTYADFRAILAALLSFAFVVVLGPRVIRWLMKQKIGDRPEFYNKSLNELTKSKANTPTMGGVLIAGSILFSTALLADLSSFYVAMAIICLVWLFVVGLIDDWLKLTGARRALNRREGLYSGEKLLLQFGLAVVLGLFIHHHGMTKLKFESPEIMDMSRALTLPFMKAWVYSQTTGWQPSSTFIVLPAFVFVVLTVIVITGSSNAVNLTDGMDGLASGIMSIVGFAFLVLSLIAGNEQWAKFLLVPYIPLSGELAIVCGGIVGACVGFLWYNCHPAQVFMGDTGSLPLGGLIGYIAVVIRQEFLLLIIGGVFVMEALSVLMQVGYFKASKGKRIFKCAPIHHHFHLSGWTEQQVVVRFWIISIILAAIALGTIRIR